MTRERGVFWGTELYNYNVKKDPVIEHMLYKNDIVCIAARPGTGKSLLLNHMICNLTTGNDFLDLFGIPKPCNVLYFQAEGDRAETIERMGNFKLALACDDGKWVHINQVGLVLNSRAGISELIQMAKKPGIHYDVIMIDPLYATIQGDICKNQVATDWQRNVKLLQDIWQASLIVTHHETKDSRTRDGQVIEKAADDLMGSVYWAAFFNHNFKLVKRKGIHHLVGGKQRSGKIIDEVVMKLEEPSPLFFNPQDTDIDLSERKVMLMLQEHDKVTAKRLSELCEISQATTYRAIKTLTKNGKVKKIVDNGIHYYRWVQ